MQVTFVKQQNCNYSVIVNRGDRVKLQFQGVGKKFLIPHDLSHFIVNGFESLNLHRIYAFHLTRNPALGRVLQKIGMSHEGCWRQHTKHWGVYEDVAMYGILATEWQERKNK